MKKYFLILLISLSFLPAATLAFTDFGSKNLDSAVKDNQGYYSNLTDTNTIVGNVVNAVLAIAGTVFLVLTVYAGITWMTAAGNSEKIDKAKNIIITAAIGIVITVSAYGITLFLMNKIGNGSGGVTQTCAEISGDGYYDCDPPNGSCTDATWKAEKTTDCNVCCYKPK